MMQSEKRFYLWLAVAALLHTAVLTGSLFLQIEMARKEVKPKIVNITLVSLPVSDGTKESVADRPLRQSPLPQPVAVKKIEKSKEALLPKSSNQAVVVKKKPLNLSPPIKKVEAKQVSHPKPLNQPVAVKAPSSVPAAQIKKVVAGAVPAQVPQPADDGQGLTRALERIKQNIAGNASTSEPASDGTVDEAIAKIRQKQKATLDGVPAVPGNPGGRGNISGSNSGAGKSGATGVTPFAYNADIKSIIQKNWSFSNSRIANSNSLWGMERKIQVRIYIRADGSISQIKFEKTSPSEFLNNSVKKAFEKSALPSPPKEGWYPFIFTPQGIQK